VGNQWTTTVEFFPLQGLARWPASGSSQAVRRCPPPRLPLRHRIHAEAEHRCHALTALVHQGYSHRRGHPGGKRGFQRLKVENPTRKHLEGAWPNAREISGPTLPRAGEPPVDRYLAEAFSVRRPRTQPGSTSRALGPTLAKSAPHVASRLRTPRRPIPPRLLVLPRRHRCPDPRACTAPFAFNSARMENTCLLRGAAKKGKTRCHRPPRLPVRMVYPPLPGRDRRPPSI
jgi:hypothetical protein